VTNRSALNRTDRSKKPDQRYVCLTDSPAHARIILRPRHRESPPHTQRNMIQKCGTVLLITCLKTGTFIHYLSQAPWQPHGGCQNAYRWFHCWCGSLVRPFISSTHSRLPRYGLNLNLACLISHLIGCLSSQFSSLQHRKPSGSRS
jgi:hypothetical protein